MISRTSIRQSKEKLLWETIRFAKLFISITNKGIEVIFHARKSLLYYNDEPSDKKGKSNFDVTMGAFDGEEVRELIGIFMLLLLSKHIIKNYIGLYRDEGLAILKNISGPEAKKLKKKFRKLFKEKNLDILPQCNLKITNYLDITFKRWIIPPLQKIQRRNQLYSDQPPSIIKENPRSVEKRLSVLSSSKNIFQESVIYYEKCLENSGYKTKLQYQQAKQNNQNKKKRKRNIIWFNPPYNKSVKANIRTIFIKLISKHFPPNHKYIKIFNRNTIKLYSCMPKSDKKNGHNKKMLQPKSADPKKLCKCLVKEDWPMNGLCLKSST